MAAYTSSFATPYTLATFQAAFVLPCKHWAEAQCFALSGIQPAEI